MDNKVIFKRMKQTTKLFLVLMIFVFASMTMIKAQPNTGPGIDPDALLLMDFENGDISGWTIGSAGRGEKISVELMDAEKGDPVRFGRYAVKLDWDFTAAQTSQTLGAYFSPPGNAFVIPAANRAGSHKIGMWIYASPECDGVIWFRLQLFTPAGASGSASTVLNEFISEPSYTFWTGWKYHEFTFPSKANSNLELGPPAATNTSYAMFRMMSVSSSTVQRPLTKGYFIIDNIRVTSVTEDIIPPAINSLTGNDTDLPAIGTLPVFTTGTMNFSASFSDTGGSEMNFESIRVIVDGYTFKVGDAGFTVNQTDANSGSVSLSGLNLSNGTHNVVVHVEDKFGNIATKTGTFTINDPAGPTTNVTLEPSAQALAGNAFEMKINTNDSEFVKELEISIQLNEIGTVDATGGVVFAASAQGSSYSFNKTPLGGVLTINLVNNITFPAVETLATINVNIAKNSNPTDVLRVSPLIAKSVFADETISLFSLFDAFTRTVTASYDFMVTKRVVGAMGEVSVTDLTGNPVSGASVYALNNGMTDVIASAVTDETGFVALNFTNTAQVYIYVEKDGKYSYTLPVRSLTPLLTASPSGIRSGTTVDPTSTKTITWMSHPVNSAEPSIMKYAKKTDGEDSFQQITGATKILEFDALASNGVVKGSAVTVEGLEPGTTYIYQVGDGDIWSPIREFTTTTVSDQYSFSAFGDFQASSSAQASRWVAAAGTIENTNPKPFFSLNVGDVNDTDDRWDYASYYKYLLDQRQSFANIDMISAYGNHEYMGTPDADNAKFINGHPFLKPSPVYDIDLVGNGSYVVRYGNAMIFALDWEPKGNVAAVQNEQAKWIDDVLTKNPDVVWKIVTLHYPIFPAESSPGSQGRLQPVFDKHNVQLVFCGHGHTFERVQAKATGVTSGSNRRTFQPVTGNGTLHFQIGDMVATNDNGRWVFCEVAGKKMTFTIRDANNNIVANECFTLFASEPGDEYTVTFNTVNENGTLEASVDLKTITSGSSVLECKDVVFIATPDEGYKIKEWKHNGKPVNGTASTYTITILADEEVTVEFEPVKYTVTFNTVNDYGSLDASVDDAEITNGEEVQHGKDVVFIATPDEGYTVKEWRLNEKTISGNTSNIYTLTGISETADVTVEFEITTFAVSFNVVNGNGTITASVDGSEIATGKQVQQGKDVVFTATPNSGYRIKEWKLNNTAVNGTASVYTLENLKEVAIVSVEFEVITSSGEDLSVNPLKAWKQNGILHVSGLTSGAILNVYNTSGALVYQNVAKNEEEDIPIRDQGVYIVQSGNHSIRVVF